jgi:hypothetical protein
VRDVIPFRAGICGSQHQGGTGKTDSHAQEALIYSMKNKPVLYSIEETPAANKETGDQRLACRRLLM